MKRSLLFLAVTILTFSCKKNISPLPYQVTQTATADSAMVVTAHPLSSKVGVDVLKKGGNAVDAAIATQFALAVVYPRAGNLGGGGFMVIRMNDGEVASIDYREKAPAKASKDMYLDENDEVIPELSTHGAMAVGVPGTVAGMAAIHEKHGSLEWSELVQPAVDLAEGFPILKAEAERLNRFKDDFVKHNRHPTAFVSFFSWKEGDVLSQPELKSTLSRIRDNGKAGFYEGKTADLLVEEMKAGGGIISKEDLKNYNPVWRKPLIGDYKGYKIISMPPASSGGVALLQMLEMSETFPLGEWGFHQPKTVHAMGEVMRRAYADRAAFLGDSDFYPVPLDSLLDSIYLSEKLVDFDLAKASLSDSISDGAFKVNLESLETTHTSIVDPSGNAVSVTTTINSNFGSKVVVKGGGFFLNNEMDDFSSKPGVPNLYGLVGSEANSIAPGKRMLSSMTPTIVVKDNKPFLLLGTPGGSTIITSVYQTFMNVVEFNMSLEEAVAAPRFHHQWLPDALWLEEGGFDESLIESLSANGHNIDYKDRMAKMKCIHVLPDGKLIGVGDPRVLEDSAEGF